MATKERTFTEKVIEVQKNLKAPKSQFNKFGKYKYRSAEDILNSVKPLLADMGLLLTIQDELIHDGARYYIKATATLTDGTNHISTNAYAREDEVQKGFDGSQITGSASSYARKYALNGLFCDGTANANNNAHEERIALALQEIKGAQSCTTLTQIWNNYHDLQSDARFSQAIADASKKYPKQ